ncbi:MAG: uL15m family ribosomal protein [Nanoarchaeota archaeon]
MKYRRKKNVRLRGSKTHAWGAMKKHRGAGHRGGRGRAGSGKRADQKKPSYWKEKNWEGKHGFTSKSRAHVSAINIKDLDQTAEKLAKEQMIQKAENTYTINLKELGYTTLLGTGSTAKKFIITAEHASRGAREKIKAAGGDILGLKPRKQKKIKGKAHEEKEHKEQKEQKGQKKQEEIKEQKEQKEQTAAEQKTAAQ